MKKLLIALIAVFVAVPLYAVRYNFNADFGVKPGDNKAEVIGKFKKMGIVFSEKNNGSGGKYFESPDNVVLRGDTITVKLVFKKNVLGAMWYIYNRKGWKHIQPQVDSLVTYRADKTYDTDDGYICIFDTMVMSVLNDDYTLLFYRDKPKKKKK